MSSRRTKTSPRIHLGWLAPCALALALAACVGDKGDPGATGPQGATGPAGAAGAPCTVAANGDGTKTISCPDGTNVTVRDGANGASGADGTSCSVTDDGAGTKTITCTDGTTATVTNGRDGTNGTDGTDGTNGTNGTSCSVTDNGDGTKTITCTDGTTATVSDGTNGTNGSNGTDGTSCTVAARPDGTKTITCTDGTWVTVSPPISRRIDPRDDLPGLVVAITAITGASNADGTFAVGDHLAVTFSVETNAGAPIELADVDAAEVWVAGPTTNFQHVIPWTRDALTLEDVKAHALQNPDGTYTYAFDVGIPATYGVPINDTTKFTEGELTGPLQAGTYRVSLRVYRNYAVGSETIADVGWDVDDFLFDHATDRVTHEVITTASCNQCHVALQVHGGTYRSTELCVTCHTSGAEDLGSTNTGDATPVTIDFRVMIHKLHNALHLPSVLGVSTNADGTRNYAATAVPYVIGDTDYSGTTFPVFPNYNIALPKDLGYSALTSAQKSKEDGMRRGVTACEKCHGDPDGDRPLPAPADGANYANVLTRRACGSCHDDIDWSRPYTANGATMPPQSDDTNCSFCHPASGTTLAVIEGHRHPLHDPAVNPDLAISISGMSGGTASNGGFQVGDSPVVTFSINDGNGTPFPVTSLDSMSMTLLGPTYNRQVVFPYATTNGITLNPYDFTGRLAAASTSNKGLMSKAVPSGATLSETLAVAFTSATAFDVVGRTSGSLGSSALPASTSTYPSGASVANFKLSPSVVPGLLVVTFSSATDFSVSLAGVVIGTGRLPSSVSGSTRFVSTDASVAFNLTVGTTAYAAGNTVNAVVFKGSASNPVVFAVVAGRTAFATGDRFYYDYVAPGPTYTTHLPMDLPLEYLGRADGNPGQVLTAANTPVWYGRQSLYERTAVVGTQTTLVAASAVLSRIVDVAAIDAGLASGDYVVLDNGGTTEEYVQISSIDSGLRRITFRTPVRFAHAAGTAFQEATLTYRQEGTHYTLDPAAGTVTLLNGAPNGAPLVMNYRTDARFGWRRALGDALQTTYAPPYNDTPNFDETWGDWGGKPWAPGTYTVGVWGYSNLDYVRFNELQTYRGTSPSGLSDILFGGATTLQPYTIVSSGDKCQECHDDLSFHGGGRLGADVCFLCHAIAGGQAGATETVNFRTFIHEAHEGTFPAMPGGVKNCSKCHGTAVNWQDPPSRDHPTAQTRAVRSWFVTCGACHTSRAANAHFDVNTAASGDEACGTCHGPGKDLDVTVVHRPR